MPLRFADPSPQAYQYPLTIGHLLDSAMVTAASEEIIYRDRSRYTYRVFRQRIGRLASLLTSIGAEQGMTVAMLDWDSHRYLEAYFAVPMMGAVLMSANIRLPAEQLAYTLDHARAEILLVHRDFFPLIEPLLPSLSGVKAIVAIMDGDPDAHPDWAVGEYETLSASASPEFSFKDFDENAIATSFYTSGTTGSPKGVCFSHRQLVLHTLAACGPFGANPLNPLIGFGSVYMPLTPMFHVHAWGMPYVATMLGIKQVYPGRYDADTICRLRSDHKVSFSHCVPTVLRMVLEAADRTGSDLSGWTMVIGGSALSRSLCAEGRRRGMEIITGYGMSETAPLVAIARRSSEEVDDEEALVDAMCAAGPPVPLVSARIVDEDMRDVPHDGSTRGELVFRAPWLTPCYVGDENASNTLWRGGWLHTQDVATIDEQGRIRIRDRLKDVIKTGGEWVDSIQLEELIASVDGVAEVSVVGVPDEKWGERPLAVIVPRRGYDPGLADLNRPIEMAIASGVLTRYARLERFTTVPELPRTSVGKIDKKLLRQTYGIAT